MSVPDVPPPDGDPAETGQDGPAARRDDRERDQAEVDAAFAALVAGWDAPAPERPAPAVPPAPVRRPEPRREQLADPVDGAEDDPGVDEEEDEGHFEPPEPPALPRLSARAVGGLLVLLAGVVLLVSPGLVGLTDGVGLPVGLLVAAAGLAVLLSRLRPGPDPDSGWDDGARL